MSARLRQRDTRRRRCAPVGRHLEAPLLAVHLLPFLGLLEVVFELRGRKEGRQIKRQLLDANARLTYGVAHFAVALSLSLPLSQQGLALERVPGLERMPPALRARRSVGRAPVVAWPEPWLVHEDDLDLADDLHLVRLAGKVVDVLGVSDDRRSARVASCGRGVQTDVLLQLLEILGPVDWQRELLLLIVDDLVKPERGKRDKI